MDVQSSSHLRGRIIRKSIKSHHPTNMNQDMNSNSSISVIEHNTKGVVYMQQGDHAKAASMFQGGMSALATGLRVQEQPPVTKTPTSASDNQDVSRNFMLHADGSNTAACTNHGTEHQKLLHSVPVAGGTTKLCEDESVFVFFNRALHIVAPADLHYHYDPTYYTEHLLSGVLLFNLALLHHRMGVARGNSKALTKALKFYSLSLASLRGLPQDMQEQSNLASLAVVNNVGHIHAYYRRHEQVKRSSLELARCLLALPTSDLGLCFSDEEKKVFFFNAYFFRKVKLSAASAA